MGSCTFNCKDASCMHMSFVWHAVSRTHCMGNACHTSATRFHMHIWSSNMHVWTSNMHVWTSNGHLLKRSVLWMQCTYPLASVRLFSLWLCDFAAFDVLELHTLLPCAMSKQDLFDKKLLKILLHRQTVIVRLRECKHNPLHVTTLTLTVHLHLHFHASIVQDLLSWSSA